MEVVMSVGIGLLSAASSLLILSGDGELRSDWDELGRTRDRTVTWARGMRASIVGRAEERGLALPGSRKKRERLEGAMVEAFGALAASMASGLSLAQAMRYVGSHAQEPVRTEFLRAEAQVACGAGMTAALDELVERLHAPGLDFVTLALKVSRRTGAPLSDVLGEAARLVRERVELRRKLDVRTAQVRMSARLVAGMPVAMVAFLALVSSDFREGIATVPGAASIAVALLLDGIAWSIIRVVMRSIC